MYIFIWDVIYEHCSYFTPVSLSFAFSSCGFRVCNLTEEFEDQFLCLDALLVNQHAQDSGYALSNEVNRIASDIASFATNYRKKVQECRDKLEQIEGGGQRVVAWGAGSKGVTFLNTFRNQHQIKYVVDINPHKQGMFVPGTGQQIVPPEFLKKYKPDVIVVMNPIYKSEIRELTDKLGLTTNFMYV